jgi:hypothetical protein
MEWALANLFSHLMFTIILTVFKTQNVSFKLKTKKKKRTMGIPTSKTLPAVNPNIN